MNAARRVAALYVLLLLGACTRHADYSQATPEAAMASAVSMVEHGDARRLPDLIYADSDRMRALLDRLGVLTEHMQQLAAAARDRFPDEIKQLRREAENSAGDGGGIMSLLGSMKSGADGGDIRDLLARVYADPYGWIRRSAGRVTFVKVSDEMAMVYVDDKPALPPLGMSMRRDGGKWYLQLPTNLVGKFMPRTDDQWAILGSIIGVFDKAAVELTQDVHAGRINGLKELGRKAGDRLFMPGMIAFSAYSKEIEVREKLERLLGRFHKRLRQWTSARAGGGGADPPICRPLLDAINRMAPVQLEAAVRRRDRPDLEKMDRHAFEAMLGEWFRFYGLDVSLGGDLASQRTIETVQAWDRRVGPKLPAPPIRRIRDDEPIRYLRRWPG